MPTVSLFFGIRITMNHSEVKTPHFSVEYANSKASVAIKDGTIIAGNLPSRQLKLVLAWAEIHRDELMQNREPAKDCRELNEIAPLR